MGNKNVIIDYLSATGGMHIDDAGERIAVSNYLDVFKEYFNLEEYQIKDCPYATNNFKYQYVLSDFITLRFGGPLNDFLEPTWQIELKGEGCREIERLKPDSNWYDFFIFLIGFGLSLKRLDVTIDDYLGNEITIFDIFEKAKKKQYTSIFRAKPTYHGIPEDGLTIDFGSRTSFTELCIYDKKKQQEYLGNRVDYDYWVRYEMRFRQKKAEAVLLDLIKNYKNLDIPVYGLNLQDFAEKALYATIDFKEENNYSEHDQSKAETDPRWKTFVGDIKKGKLPSPDLKKSTYESAYNYIMPKAKNILLTWFIQCNCDWKVFCYRVLTELKSLSLKSLNLPQQKRINQYIAETSKNRKPLNPSDFDKILLMLDQIEDEITLPF